MALWRPWQVQYSFVVSLCSVLLRANSCCSSCSFTILTQMKAIVIEQPGAPECLQIRDIPRPFARPGWVLVQVRSLRTQPLGDVHAARAFGCGGQIPAGARHRMCRHRRRSLAIHSAQRTDGGGGDGRHGPRLRWRLRPVCVAAGYASRCRWKRKLPWPSWLRFRKLISLAWGCLVEAMELKRADTVLVRGGTSSVGMAAISLAKEMGMTVAATTRNAAKAQALIDCGADHVVIDHGRIAADVKRVFDGGVNGVVELIGTTTLLDSLRCAAPKGIVCYAGMLGNQWMLERFEPGTAIPSTVKLTYYTTHTVTAANSTQALQRIVRSVESGRAAPQPRSHIPLRADRRSASIHGRQPRNRQARSRRLARHRHSGLPN